MAKNKRKTWVTCAMCGVLIRAEIAVVEIKGRENFICQEWCKGGNNE